MTAVRTASNGSDPGTGDDPAQIQDEVDARLEGIAAPLRDLLDDIEEERAEARRRVAALDDKARRVSRTLKALEPDPPRPSRVRPKKNQVSPELHDAALAALKAAPDGLTYGELASGVGKSDNAARVAVAVLRERGEARRAGRRTKPNGAPGAHVFKALGES